ncbi:MAG TPA: MlaD family protein [Terriglobales bacterium]|nr:MlaD family protein [Terriglobales bacterium]
MPSQQQVRWSELRVGLTVLFAAIVLGILIFLMTGTTGLFTPKVNLKAFFENASGLRVGAPVRLEGVDIGNVTSIRVVSGRPASPVEVVMKVTTKYGSDLRKDSVATLATAGVLGETYVDISSKTAKGPPAKNWDVLQSEEVPDLSDVVRASQTTLQNVDILVRRLDRIVAAIERGEGSVGKLIYDPSLFNKLNATLDEIQATVNDVSKGKGSIGKLITSDELYNKLNDSVTKINKMVDEMDKGQGTVGKLIKDPSLYNNANETMAKANRLMADVNEGRGTLGKIAHDPEFANKVDRTVSNLADITDRMDKGEGTVGKLFKDPSLYNNADQMLVETRNLVQAIRENPKKYLTIHFRVF